MPISVIEVLIDKEKAKNKEKAIELYNRVRVTFFYLKQKYGYYRGYPVMIHLYMNRHPCRGLNDFRAKFLWLHDL